MLQSGIERKFEIVGEALNRIKRDAPEMLDQIREHRSIISFRNILVHGYNGISNRIVWGVIEEDLDNLIEDVGILIKDKEKIGLRKMGSEPLTYDNLSKSLNTFPLGFYHSLLSFKTSGLLWPLRKSSAFFMLYPRWSDPNPVQYV